MTVNLDKLEKDLQVRGREILEEARNNQTSMLSPDYYTERMFTWAMRDPEFKTNLFRFVDVLPALKSSAAVIEHAQEYFSDVREIIPSALRWGLSLNPRSLPAQMGAQVVRNRVKGVASKFIVGETPERSLRRLRKLRQDNIAFTIDLLGEATVSEKEAEAYQQRYLELLDTLSSAVPKWKEAKSIVENHKGEQTPIHISVKLSALYSQIKPEDSAASSDALVRRLVPILVKAKSHGAFVCVDMEDSALTEITLDAFKKALETAELKDYDRVGIVLQAYLRRSAADLDQLLAWVERRGTPIGVRLVKGAYWDHEVVLAKQRGWPVPVWQQKAASDQVFEQLALNLLSRTDLVFPAFGSHNIRSLCFSLAAAEQLGVPSTDFELQCLFGMGANVKQAFVGRGFLVRDYAPIGELIPGMGYLVRRLLENTANEGFLRMGFFDNESSDVLLAPPVVLTEDSGVEHLERSVRDSFFNVAPLDFTLEESRTAFQSQVDELKRRTSSAPDEVAPIINGQKQVCKDHTFSTAPEQPSWRLAKIDLAPQQTAADAISELTKAFPAWRDTPIEERAEILFRAAEIMTARRVELAAIMAAESAKPWKEADGDVAEAIDFLNYYAHEAIRLGRRQKMGDLPGEHNTYFYEPRGLTLVVAPWNFPLAIPCGMLSASLVTGNVSVLKPATHSALIASKLFEILLEAGLPPSAAAFLPGKGSEIGDFLGSHPDIHTIVFTGSKEVGLQLIQSSGETAEGQHHVKRVIAEMGGKNAIIVDEDADLDEAIKGVVYSAFGYQGQKCSACSRVIVVGTAYEGFIERLADAVKSLPVGPPTHSGTFVGPVIDSSSKTKLLQVIKHSESQCTLLAQAEVKDDGHNGHFVPPTVFTDIPDGHTLLREELFGPVLAVIRAASLDEALQKAVDSEYALTGAIFSRSPGSIDRAVKEFRVGNLYINRGSTAAIVMRQPFGGFKLSGIGSKAGGPDYLLQFCIPRSVTENTMRRGFTPDL